MADRAWPAGSGVLGRPAPCRPDFLAADFFTTVSFTSDSGRSDSMRSDATGSLGTAGAAYGKGELSVGGLTNDQTHWGWTIGAGVEAMLTQNVSAKFEYLYVDLSDRNYATIGGPVNVGYTTNLLRGGVNYRF